MTEQAMKKTTEPQGLRVVRVRGRSLWEISEEVAELDAAVSLFAEENQGDITEIEAMAESLYAQSEGDLAAKLDNYAALILSQEGLAETREAWGKKQVDTARRIKTAMKKLRQVAADALVKLGRPRVECARSTVSVKRHGGKDPIEQGRVDDLPPEMVTETLEMPGEVLVALGEGRIEAFFDALEAGHVKRSRKPILEKIRERLLAIQATPTPCTDCEGDGQVAGPDEMVTCTRCLGGGLEPSELAGFRFGERGHGLVIS